MTREWTLWRCPVCEEVDLWEPTAQDEYRCDNPRHKTDDPDKLRAADARGDVDVFGGVAMEKTRVREVIV